MSKKPETANAETTWNVETVSAKSRKAIITAAQNANTTAQKWLDDRVSEWLEDASAPTFHADTLRVVLKLTANVATTLAAKRDKERSLGRNEIANMYRDQCEGIEAVRSLVSGLAQINGVDNSEIAPPQNVEPIPPLP